MRRPRRVRWSGCFKERGASYVPGTCQLRAWHGLALARARRRKPSRSFSEGWWKGGEEDRAQSGRGGSGDNHMTVTAVARVGNMNIDQMLASEGSDDLNAI